MRIGTGILLQFAILLTTTISPLIAESHEEQKQLERQEIETFLPYTPWNSEISLDEDSVNGSQTVTYDTVEAQGIPVEVVTKIVTSVRATGSIGEQAGSVSFRRETSYAGFVWSGQGLVSTAVPTTAQSSIILSGSFVQPNRLRTHVRLKGEIGVNNLNLQGQQRGHIATLSHKQVRDVARGNKLIDAENSWGFVKGPLQAINGGSLNEGNFYRNATINSTAFYTAGNIPSDNLFHRLNEHVQLAEDGNAYQYKIDGSITSNSAVAQRTFHQKDISIEYSESVKSLYASLDDEDYFNEKLTHYVSDFEGNQKTNGTFTAVVHDYTTGKVATEYKDEMVGKAPYAGWLKGRISGEVSYLDKLSKDLNWSFLPSDRIGHLFSDFIE